MKSVLLIEDEDLLRENTKELLEEYGYRCMTAHDGREGLKLAVQNVPDVVICDVLLPFMTGYEIKEELNKLTETANIPFIFLTAKMEREDQRKGMDLGAQDYITKPFRIKELVNSLNSRLAQKDAMKEIVNTQLVTTISEFIHISKHECNTPLHAIITLSELMSYPEYNDKEFIHKASTAINSSGKRLFKTLNNLIDLVRLKHYHSDVESGNQPVSVNGMLEDIAARYMTPEKKDHMHLYMENILTDTILKEDLNLLMSELIDNAVKYANVDGEVNVHLEVAGGKKSNLILTVENLTDEIIDFNENDIEPFSRAGRRENKKQGSGLGLYLALLVTKKYKGNLVIDYSQDKVFTARVFLPISE